MLNDKEIVDDCFHKMRQKWNFTKTILHNCVITEREMMYFIKTGRNAENYKPVIVDKHNLFYVMCYWGSLDSPVLRVNY